MAIISALTFLPSLLIVFGRIAFGHKFPHYKLTDSSTTTNTGIWAKAADFIANHARLTWLVTAALLLAAAIGLVQLKADGVPQSELILGKSSARDGQEIIRKHFCGGSGTPAQIIVPIANKDAVIATLDASQGVASVAIKPVTLALVQCLLVIAKQY